VEFVTWTNKDTPVSGTTTVSTTAYNVSNGTITVPVNVTSPYYGYRVYITPKSDVSIRDNCGMLSTAKQINMHTDAVRNLLTISLPDKSENRSVVSIFNSTGSLVKSEGFSGQNGSIMTSDLVSGLYVANIKFDNQSFTQKFLLK
jgi:hypothetical protein